VQEEHAPLRQEFGLLEFEIQRNKTVSFDTHQFTHTKQTMPSTSANSGGGSSSSGPVETFIANVDDFNRNGMRHLIKVGMRNIAVYCYRGQYFAIDNACYHHGGPLLQGDIEDLGGHPCVVCPWHSYRIALDTGEGLYWGISVPEGGGAPQQQLKTKGKKQRCHTTLVREGKVYCVVDVAADAPTLESDHYALLPIANSDAPTGRSVVMGPGGASGLHSGLRSGHVFGSSGPQQQQQQQLGPSFGNPNPPVIIRCVKLIPRSVGVVTFVFEKVEGVLTKRLDPGMHATIGLPIGPNGSLENRTYTVTSVRSAEDGGWFTLTVKLNPASRGGSRWLHTAGEELIHNTQIPLISIGGAFTVAKLRSRINSRGGMLLMISAGVGITPMFASLNVFLRDQFTLASGPPLHVVHVHVDKDEQSVPFLDGFLHWQKLLSNNKRGVDPVTYRFIPKYTQSGSGRPTQEDWRKLLLDDTFQTADVLVMLCGPPAFMRSVQLDLTSNGIGVSANNIVTEAFDF
jgi:ferredoxin-NADP reductase/nitrite reductase/ring-hydroxylating ferredoxin subunit